MLRALTHVSTASPASAGAQGRFTGGVPGVQRRIMAALGAVFVALVALFALLQPAVAEGETISGRLENRGESTKTPMSGVTITVMGEGFEGSTTSGADGKWVIEVPGQGDYVVSIDTATLPEGVALTDPSKLTVVTT